jgi:hypothetical protein
MALPRHFDAGDLRTVEPALGAAEQFTGRFYCIPGRDWSRFPYEVTTTASGEPPRDWAFADVVRVLPFSTAPIRRHGFGEHFRIRLRDDVFLSAVEEPDREIDLFPLLLWVLTHELVHVVRFGSGLAPFDAAADARQHEEHRVHEITERVLHPALDDGLRRAGRLCAG